MIRTDEPLEDADKRKPRPLNLGFAQLQQFLRRDHQKTTGIYAGHIEMGTRKQTDYLADFWQRKLIDSDTVAAIPASIKGKK